MANLDWPTALIPQHTVVGIKRAGPQFRGPFNGQLQVLDTSLAARLTMSCTLPPALRADAGAAEAYLFQIAGGINKAKAWHFGRPVPIGSLRNAPTLGVAAARGDASITLASAFGRNRLLNSSFEVDSNADGMSDSWLSAVFGTTGAITNLRTGPSPVPTSTFQRVTAAALGATVGDQAGVQQLLVNVADLVGQNVTLSAYLAASAGTYTFELRLNFITSLGGFISASSATFVDTSGAFVRRSLTAIVPANAATATVFVVMKANTGGGTCTIDIDGVQLEPGALTDYELSATLKAGDMLGLGNHLLMTASDCAATAAAAMVVPLVNRIRETVAGGTAVVWSRPTALWVAPALTAGVAHHPGEIDGAAVELEEWWP